MVAPPALTRSVAPEMVPAASSVAFGVVLPSAMFPVLSMRKPPAESFHGMITKPEALFTVGPRKMKPASPAFVMGFQKPLPRFTFCISVMPLLPLTENPSLALSVTTLNLYE